MWTSILLLLGLLAAHVKAYPYELPDCNFPTSGQSLPNNGDFYMGISNVGDGSSGECKITALPSSIEACASVDFTITSVSGATIVNADVGKITQGSTKTDSCAYYVELATTHSFTYTAPETGTEAVFTALCGQQGGVYAAASVTIPIRGKVACTTPTGGGVALGTSPLFLALVILLGLLM